VADLVTGMIEDLIPDTDFVHASGVRFGLRDCLLAATQPAPTGVLQESPRGQ
jgi:hypothetical protein